MRVRVKLYASLRRFAPNEASGVSFEVELPDGATLLDLVQRLHIPTEEAKLTFVNGLAQSLDYPLQPDDEVGIFPPIGGGNHG